MFQLCAVLCLFVQSCPTLMTASTVACQAPLSMGFFILECVASSFSRCFSYSIIKRNKIMPSAATWTDLEIIMLSEVSQAEKDKYMISLICGI